MPSQEQPKLPIIDFSPNKLKSGTSHWVSICKNVRQALEDYGCFVASYDDKVISSELHNSVFDLLVDLFDLPLETKTQNASGKPYHGYFGQNPHMPLNQSMGIEDAQILSRTQNFTNLMWPRGNKRFWYKYISIFNYNPKNFIIYF